jgi:hypothetical protein
MKNNQKYIDNARIWGKRKISSEKVLALKEMIKMAGKHTPHLVPLLRKELWEEHLRIRRENSRRLRQSIIGR